LREFEVVTRYTPDQRTPSSWLLSHIFRHKLLLVTMFIGAFGNAALAAYVPVVIGIAFQGAMAQPPDLRLIGVSAVSIIISQTVRAVLQWGRNFSSAVIGERLERDIREELYASLLGKSMTFHDLQPVGDTMARATNDVHEVNLLLNPGINLIVGSANFMLMPVLLAPRYDWQLLLAPLFFVITYGWALRRYLKTLDPIADRVRLAFGTMNSRLAEALDGIEVVKGAAQEEQEIDLFEENAREYREGAVEQGKVEARFLPLLLLGVTQALGFTHALLLFQAGRVDVGDVVAYMGLLSLFGFPTFISLTAYSRIILGVAGARRILALINTQTSLDENVSGYQGTIQGALRFEQVTFGYVEGSAVLQDISFTVDGFGQEQPGQTGKPHL
jgi:ATP-binding cassette, subfamily B, bacterial